jgi:cytochrome c-type biogenesis protein CcmF
MFFGSIGLILYRRDGLRTEHRIDSLLSREAMFLLQNLVLVAMVFVIFWITLFPLISDAITGTKVSVGPPAFTPFIVPLALILVVLAGAGPMISWRRATLANLKQHFIFPVSFGVVVTIALVALTNADTKPLALTMFGFGAFLMASVAQEMYRGTAARRAMTRDAWPVAFVALIRRNRRRYGGYIAHFGLAVMLIGVAASSSFQHSRNATLRPGQSVSNDGYVFHYVRPIAVATAERISFGAVLDVTKGGKQVTTLRTEQRFYPSTSRSDGIISRFFDSSNADSTIGLDAGALRDIWTVVSANLQPLANDITKGDKLFAGYMNSLLKKTTHMTAAQQTAYIDSSGIYTLRDEAVDGIVSQYTKHGYPVEFLLIVAPLVTWLWVGAFIIALGGLISMWPAPRAVRRRSPSVARSRAARELV